MKFVLGPIIIVLSILMMKYTVWITNQVGKIDLAEKYLKFPFAGTYTWWRLIGLLLIIFALLWMGGFVGFGGSELVAPN
ncbi:MAG: hypothetical protein R3B41_03540 [Candidatus Doudnabacteria bacterium]